MTRKVEFHTHMPRKTSSQPTRGILNEAKRLPEHSCARWIARFYGFLKRQNDGRHMIRSRGVLYWRDSPSPSSIGLPSRLSKSWPWLITSASRATGDLGSDYKRIISSLTAMPPNRTLGVLDFRIES